MPRVSSPDNAESFALLQSLRGTDESRARHAFAALFEQLYPSLTRFALTFLHTVDAAEDAVCEVFAQLWLQRQSLAVQSSLDVYLLGAVRHRALNIIRGDRRASTWEARLKDTDEYPALGTTAHLADAVLEGREDREAQLQALHAAITTLSPKSRQVLLLRWGHQLSFAEIAEVMQTTPGAAQTMVSRALQALRERV